MLQWILENTMMALVMAVGVCLACRVFRAKPAVCHFLWALVLARLVMPPVSIAHWPPAPMRSQVATLVERHSSGVSTEIARFLSLSGGADRIDSRSVDAGSAAPVQPNPIEPALLPERVASTPEAEPPLTSELPANSSVEWPSEPPGDSAAAPEWASAPAKAAPPLNEEMAATEMARYLGERKDYLADKRDLIEKGDWPAAAIVSRGGLLGASGRIIAAALLALWLGGVVIALAIHGRRIARFHAAVRRAPLASDWLTRRVRDLAEQLRIAAPVVRLLPGLSSPVIWGFGTPTLIWPPNDVQNLEHDSERCDGIIVHELAHLRRRDHWLAWLEIIAISLLWWHPLAHLARRRLHEYADLACDSWVVSMLPGHRRRYAASIVDLIEQLSTAPRAALALGVGTSSHRALVERRLVMIVKERTSCRLSPVAALLALFAAAVLVPSWAGGALERLAPPPEVAVDPAIAPAHRPLVTGAILRRRAETFFNSQDWEAAAGAYGAIVEADPDDGHAAHRLSYSLIALGELDRAEKIIKAQIEKGREPGVGHYNLACIEARRGNANAAFKELGAAITWGFADLDLINKDADLNTLREDDRFRGFAGDALFISSLKEQGQEAIGEEDYDAAVIHYSKLAKVAPKLGQAHHMLSYSSILASRGASGQAAKSEHLNRARTALKAQIDLDFLPGVARYNMACVDAIEGKVESGLNNLAASIDAGFSDLELIQTDPDLDGLRGSDRFADLVASVEKRSDAQAQVEKAMERGEYQRALELLSRIGKEGDENGDTSWSLGYALFGAGRYEEAQQAFIRALKNGHDAGDAIYNLACCNAVQGNTKAALGYLEASIDAGFTDGDHMRGDDDLASLRSDPRFETIVNKANDAGVLQNFGAADWTHLLRQSEAAIAKDSTKGGAQLRHGWALLRLGRHEEAAAAFARQRELGFAPDIASYNIACCQAKLGRSDAALDILAQLAAESENDLLTAEFIASDPDLKSLHDHPRFAEIVKAFENREHEADDTEHVEAHEASHEKPTR